MLDGLLFSVGNIFGVPASDSMSGVRKECVVGFYSVLLLDGLLHIVLVICSLLFGVRKYMALMQEGIIIGSYGVVCVLVLNSM